MDSTADNWTYLIQSVSSLLQGVTIFYKENEVPYQLQLSTAKGAPKITETF